MVAADGGIVDLYTVGQALKAALLREYHRPLEFVDVPIPEPSGPADVLVRLGGAGVCATDLHSIDGLMEAAGVALPSRVSATRMPDGWRRLATGCRPFTPAMR